jgi:hypothetical protein
MNSPRLLENQVAVIMVNGATGHVLAIDGSVYLDDEKEVYFIFDDLESAKQFIDNKREKDNTIDFSVFDFKNNLIYYRLAGM